MNVENPNEPKNMASHNLPSPLHLDVVLQDLHTLKDIQGGQNHYLKLMEVKIDQHVTLTWEPPIPFPIKLPLGLFNLLPYMLRKCDWENSSLDDFKAKLGKLSSVSKMMGRMDWQCVYGIIWAMDSQKSHKSHMPSYLWSNWFVPYL